MQFIMEKLIGPDGRIVIPDVLRTTYGFIPGTDVHIYLDENRIVLVPADRGPECCFCYSTVNLTKVGERHVCETCKGVLNNAILEQTG